MYDKIGESVRRPATCAKIIKILTYISAFLISGFGIVGFFYMITNNIISSTFFLVFSPLFIILFGGIIIAVELRIRTVTQSFEFLQSLLGKGLFYMYVSSSVFYFFTCGGVQSEVLAWSCSLTLFGLGLLFSILHFTTGSYSEEMKANLNAGTQAL